MGKIEIAEIVGRNERTIRNYRKELNGSLSEVSNA